jgi:hypothetical protein
MELDLYGTLATKPNPVESRSYVGVLTSISSMADSPMAQNLSPDELLRLTDFTVEVTQSIYCWSRTSASNMGRYHIHRAASGAVSYGSVASHS